MAPRLTYLDLPAIKVHAFKPLGELGRDVTGDMLAMFEADPRRLTYATIYDLRGFRGAFYDEDLAHFVGAVNGLRRDAGLTLPILTPQITIYPGSLEDFESVRDHAMRDPLLAQRPSHMPIVADGPAAWRQIDPDAPMPAALAAFLR